MRNVTIVVAVIGLLALLFVGTLFLEGTDEATPPSVAAGEEGELEAVSSVTAADDPFVFSRQTVADLSGGNSSERARARWQPTLRLSSPERFGRTLAEAQAATNAADVYRLIFDRLRAEPVKSSLERIRELLDKGEGSTPENYLALSEVDKQELFELLQSNPIQELMALAAEAAGKSACDFDLDYSRGFDLELPHLGPMRQLAKLCNVQMLAASDWEDPATALAMAEIGMQVNRDVTDNKLLVSGLVSIAGDRLILESLAAVSQSNLPAADAYPLLIKMAKRDYVTGMRSAIKHELEILGNSAEALAAAEKREVLVRVLESEGGADAGKYLDDDEFIARNLATVEVVAAEFLEFSQLPPSEARAAMAAQLEEVASMANEDALMAKILLPAYGKSIDRAQSTVAELDQTYIDVLTAVYRSEHGRDPQTIEDLEAIVEEARRRGAN